LRGTKEVEIVKVSLEKIPEESSGVIFIATNEKIKIGVEGKNFITKLNLGGHYVLTKDELKLLIIRSKKYQAILQCKDFESVKKVLSDD
jgi:hypothetical protein